MQTVDAELAQSEPFQIIGTVLEHILKAHVRNLDNFEAGGVSDRLTILNRGHDKYTKWPKTKCQVDVPWCGCPTFRSVAVFIGLMCPVSIRVFLINMNNSLISLWFLMLDRW